MGEALAEDGFEVVAGAGAGRFEVGEAGGVVDEGGEEGELALCGLLVEGSEHLAGLEVATRLQVGSQDADGRDEGCVVAATPGVFDAGGNFVHT
ncbi:hypothetical protein E0H75_04675 [Kribbella capetownensis]|uniref:Uncharacterized protein n=1 Tax=Kribbella capetownensis TaxID=1572659 RepID=A0A4R0JZK1_9ACTN|nr:hypothetical protein E0H75_04675 [Kribbella capetownensis]